MKETLHHKEAFEFYYSLGEKRSYTEVARKFTVSRTSVAKWSKAFNWQKRVQLRDVENAKKLEAKTDKKVVDEKTDFLNILRGTLADAVERIKSGKLGIRTQPELLKTIETALTLMGEPGTRSEMVFNVISAVPRPEKK
jgi:predicted DNA-binding protein YlxM (UPF0122 family)